MGKIKEILFNFTGGVFYMIKKQGKTITDDMVNKTMHYRYFIYIILALGYFFVYFHRTSTAVMSEDLIKSFKIAPATLGLLSSMYFYPYAVAQLPAGILADKWGARKTVSLFVIVAGIGALLFGMATSFNVALFGRALVGFGVAFIYVPIMRILADWFKKDEFATYSGLLLAIGNAGSLASAAPLVFLMGTIGWRNSMYSVGAISILIGILTYVIVRNKPEDIGGASIAAIEGREEVKNTNKKASTLENIKVIVKNYNFWTTVVMLSFMYGTIMGFQGLWASSYLTTIYHMSKVEAGNLLSIIPIGMIIGCPLSGFVSDKVIKSKKKVVLLGCILYTLTWIPLLFMIDSMSINFLRILLFFYGLFGGFFVVVYANLKENLSLDMAATGIGLLNTFVFLCGALFQQIMGAIIAKNTSNGVIALTGFKNSFIFCFAALIICILFFATQKEKKRN